MKISLNWINDFVELPNKSADDLANSFTMVTAEVEEVITTKAYLKQIKVAQIKSIKPHPEADKLNLVTFETGSGLKEVVCGASNVRPELKVPYAPIGVSLPNGLTLTPKKIRGILSEGMLCSEDELGLGEGSSGLMELPLDAQIGMTMQEFLNEDSDIVLDVDNKSLTHRPDLWGHYGLAREFAVAYERTLKNPYDKEWQQKLESKFSTDESPIIPEIMGSDTSCTSFWGLSVDGVKVGPAPKWITTRLEAAGLRSLNNIVDISNYVMLELGHPLHIYDRTLLDKEKIIVSSIKNETEFTTLDEIPRKIIPGDTVISDANKPVVLAGVMGGLNSGVQESTTKIFIEVANFKAEEVRKTSTRLGLRTDSSQRYEKSLDGKQCYRTLLRTLELICELCPQAKVVGKAEYAGVSLDVPDLEINITRDKIIKTLGYDVSIAKLEQIFMGLGFGIDRKEEEFTLQIPSYRTTKDIEGPADIIEEVGRIIGYDNIDPTSPLTHINVTRKTPGKKLERSIQDFMCSHARSLEIMTYPLVGEKLLKKVSWPNLNEDLILVNALSKDADRMRPSLIPQALETVALNAKRFDRHSFYELGRSYHSDKKNFFRESYDFVFGIFDKKANPILEVANKIENLLRFLKVPYQFDRENSKFDNSTLPKDWAGVHPEEKIEIRIMGKFMGSIFSVHPLMLRNFKVKGHLVLAAIDFSLIYQRGIKSQVKYTPISKYPITNFDCTVLVEGSTPAVKTIECLQKLKIKELLEAKIVDVYQLDELTRAVTLQVSFGNPEKTLESSFIKEAQDKVVAVLEGTGFPLKK